MSFARERQIRGKKLEYDIGSRDGYKAKKPVITIIL